MPKPIVACPLQNTPLMARGKNPSHHSQFLDTMRELPGGLVTCFGGLALLRGQEAGRPGPHWKAHPADGGWRIDGDNHFSFLVTRTHLHLPIRP